MHLNLPIIRQLSSRRRILIAGMGNGYDLFVALPIYFELKGLGFEVYLSSSSSNIVSHINIQDAIPLTDGLIGITHNMTPIPYSPAYFLANWLYQEKQIETPIWSFKKSGAATLLENYRHLVNHLDIDGLIMIDQGMDALFRGDEAHNGKWVEDALSLYVANELDEVPMRILSCTALGTDPGTQFGHVLENVSQLSKMQAFYGLCSLTANMSSYHLFQEAVMAAHLNPLQEKNMANSALVSAVEGDYGEKDDDSFNTPLWISPLMPIYWFFDLKMVAQNHLLLPALDQTFTFNEAVKAFSNARELIMSRKKVVMPNLM